MPSRDRMELHGNRAAESGLRAPQLHEALSRASLMVLEAALYAVSEMLLLKCDQITEYVGRPHVTNRVRLLLRR